MGKVEPSRRSPVTIAADADDAPLARSQIAADIAVMFVTVGIRHQHTDISTQDLGLRPTELSLGRGAEGLDEPVLVDHDHRVGNRGQNRLEVRFAGCGLAACSPHALAKGGDSHSQGDK